MSDDWQLPKAYDFHGRTVRYGVRGSGPPVVVVHGTPWSSFNLRHLIETLAADHTVHYHDLLGYGQSSMAPGDVSLAVQGRVLAELIAHWGLDRPIAVGHDFGGATVLRAHLLEGCRFSRLVLVDPVAVAPWGSPFFRHVREHEAAFAGVPDYIHQAIVRAYVRTAAHRPLDAAVLDATVAPWLGDTGRAAFYRQIAQADQRHTDEAQALYPTIDCPTLVLWGEEDSWIPVERGRALSALVPGAVLETIADAGHLVIEEAPAELGRRILRFLSRT